jgi:DNA-binding transcriptional LysR family regulator
MRYSLRQLEVFLATARHQNVTRAAASLAMSQSAASGSLRDLETQFGVQLFDRRGKRLQLSELGLALRSQAENLMTQAEAFEQSLTGQAVSGRLEIGATLTIGNYLAVGMIAAFRQLYPEVEIALSVANTETIARRVADFELGMGLVEGEIHHPDLQAKHWRNDTLELFVAPGHPLAGVSVLDDAMLADQDWILREPGSGTRQTFDRAMQGLPGGLQIAMELQHTEAIKRAVEAGLGVGCLSRISLADAFARGTLVPLRAPGRNFDRELFIITHRGKYHSAAMLRWLALCSDDRAGDD